MGGRVRFREGRPYKIVEKKGRFRERGVDSGIQRHLTKL